MVEPRIAAARDGAVYIAHERAHHEPPLRPIDGQEDHGVAASGLVAVAFVGADEQDAVHVLLVKGKRLRLAFKILPQIRFIRPPLLRRRILQRPALRFPAHGLRRRNGCRSQLTGVVVEHRVSRNREQPQRAHHDRQRNNEAPPPPPRDHVILSSPAPHIARHPFLRPPVRPAAYGTIVRRSGRSIHKKAFFPPDGA